MKRIPPILLISALAGVGAFSSAQGATILADDFTLSSDPGGTPTATISTWNTQTGLSTGTSFIAADQGGSSVNYFSDTSALSVNSPVWNVGQGWDVTFSTALASGISAISLTTLDLSAIVTNNSGGARTGGGNREWIITITGDKGYGTQSASVTSSFVNGSSSTAQIDLSGLGKLVAGENYTTSIGVRYVDGDKTYMALNDISLSGNVTSVPELQVLSLLGFGCGALLLCRRRRQAHTRSEH